LTTRAPIDEASTMTRTMLDQIADGRTDLVFEYLTAGHAAKSTDPNGVSLIMLVIRLWTSITRRPYRGGQTNARPGQHPVGARAVWAIEVHDAPRSLSLSPSRGGEGAEDGRGGASTVQCANQVSPRQAAEAEGQATGTRAWNCRGRLSNPSTIVLAQTNRRLPAGTTPNSAV
jgi:hypothetical protein